MFFCISFTPDVIFWVDGKQSPLVGCVDSVCGVVVYVSDFDFDFCGGKVKDVSMCCEVFFVIENVDGFVMQSV